MNKQPLISVIIPIHNAEEYLRECIDSVCVQTYTNLEIILVNDGSSDGCPEICDEYAAKDNRIKAIHKQNGGVSSARNAGLDTAAGEYITFIDSDDWIEADMVEFLYNNLVVYDADISCCGYYGAYDGFIDNNTCKFPERPTVLTNEQAVEVMLNVTSYIGHTMEKLYKRKIFDTFRYPLLKIFEDAAAIVDVFMAAEKILFDPTPKYYYRCRKSGTTKKNNEMTKNAWKMVMYEERQCRIEENYPQLVSVGEAYLHKKRISNVRSILAEIQRNTKHLLNNTYLTRREKTRLRIFRIAMKCINKLSMSGHKSKKKKREQEAGSNKIKKIPFE